MLLPALPANRIFATLTQPSPIKGEGFEYAAKSPLSLDGRGSG